MLWIEVLQIKSSNPDKRLQAVLRVAKSGGANAFKVLSEAAASDADARVRGAAVAAIAKMEQEGIAGVLLEAMRDTDPEVRRLAASGLKNHPGERTQLVLVEALRDSDPGVRGRAALALEQLNWRPSNLNEDIWSAVARGQMDQAAARGGPQAIEALERVLNGSPYNLQVAAVKALGGIPDERVLKSLIPALNAADSAVCVAAIEALTDFGGPKAVAALMPMLKHGDHRVRVAVVEAMPNLETQHIVRHLTALLQDPMWDVRCAAATALGKVRDPESVESLARALKDPDADVREAAAVALGRIADPLGIGPLVLALADAESSVRRAAASALPAINSKWATTDAARQMSQGLRRCLESADPAVRYAASQVLEQIGASANVIPGHDTAVVLTSAAQKHARVMSAFVELLHDADGDLRLAAAESLGRLGDKRAAEALMTVLSDDDTVVRRAAVESLRLLGAA